MIAIDDLWLVTANLFDFEFDLSSLATIHCKKSLNVIQKLNDSAIISLHPSQISIPLIFLVQFSFPLSMYLLWHIFKNRTYFFYILSSPAWVLFKLLFYIRKFIHSWLQIPEDPPKEEEIEDEEDEEEEVPEMYIPRLLDAAGNYQIGYIVY